MKSEAAPGGDPSAGGDETNQQSGHGVNVPNALCVIRLIGSFVLAGVAVANRPDVFFWLFLFLAATDWFDGKLAVLLKQQTSFGPRLDSWADNTLYLALLFGTVWLHGEALQAEFPWILSALGSYGLSGVVCLSKFGRWPTYHTRLSKTSWLLLTIGALTFLGGWSPWPLRIAMVGVTLANIEHLVITGISTRYHADVGSLRRVLRNQSSE